MAVLIDTSVAIALEREAAGLETLHDNLADERVFLAAITASELLHGVHRADTAQRRERRLRHVEAIFEATAILPFDLEVARVHSRIWADLAASGRMIGAHDLQIAATAVAHDLHVATLNREHFSRIEDLQLASWLEKGTS